MSVPPPSLDVVKNLCRDLGIVPQRQAGQNFLLDQTVADRLIAAAELKRTDVVLEIGPGFGWLTDRLARTVKQVIAVELEKRFIPWLKKQLPANVTVVGNDIFSVNLTELVTDGQYVLVSCLPYSITAKVFRQFLTVLPRPKSLALVIQREVAQRITARPGEHSKLSILVQRYARPRLIEIVPPDKFWPRPAVESAIVKVDIKLDRVASEDNAFWRLVRVGFSSRRKTLTNNLAAGFSLSKKAAEEALKQVGFTPLIRPQELGVEDWELLVRQTSEWLRK